MASTTYIPLTWKNMDLDDKKQMKVFQAQLCDWANQVQNIVGTAGGLAAVLNGGASLQGNSLKLSNTFFSSTSNQSVDCSGAAVVSVYFLHNASVTLTLNNLLTGVPVGIVAQVTSGGPFAFKIAATDPSGASYNINAKTSTTLVNMVTTGISQTNPSFIAFSFAGAEVITGTPTLNLVVN
jgi:hypothetical protein